MLKPKRLRLGDKVAIIAPASPFTKQEFDDGVAELQRLGFEPVHEPSVFAKLGGYLSGDARLRAKAVLDAWRDPSIGAIMAGRGGFRRVPMSSDFECAVLPEAPKTGIW